MMKNIIFKIAFGLLLYAGVMNAQNYSLANYSFSGNAVVKAASDDMKIRVVIGAAIIGISESNTVMLHGNNLSGYFLISNKESVENDVKSTPAKFNLFQNYPNPFNPTTTIKYEIPVTGKVMLSIYNLLGQKVSELVNKNQSAGSYEVTWDAQKFSSGVYLYQLTSGNYSVSKKLLLLK